MSRPSPLHTHIFEPGTGLPAKSKMKLSHGVAAGAEDSKYQAKYKDLKKKVKELEADNERLHFKVLEARKNVTRMKLERAVLYERLCAVPPTDEETRRGMQDPPITIPQPNYQPAGSHIRIDQADSRDPSVMEYIRNHSRPGGRPSASDSTPISVGLDINRNRGPLQTSLPSPFTHEQLEPSRSHSHSQNHTPNAAPQSNSRSSRRHEGPPVYRYPTPGESGHLDTFPHSNISGIVSPGEPGRDRQRRHELHETESHPHLPRVPPSRSPPHNGDGRIYNHQRAGPGPHINNLDRDHERHLEVDREIEQDRGDRAPNRVPTPPFVQRIYPAPIYREGDNATITTHRAPVDQEMTHELVGPGLHPSVSRSNTPASGRGGSGSAPSRPHSRVRASDERGGDMDVDDGLDVRKRTREDYERGPTTGAYLSDDRSTKKAHQEVASSVNGEGSKEVAMDAMDA